MKIPTLAAAVLIGLGGVSAAQDGGKIIWMGKGQDPVRPAYNEALDAGRPIMLLFMVQGNKECTEFLEGALSSSEVIDATAQLSCVYIECGNKKNSELVQLLDITKFPSLILVDPQGKALGQVSHRDGPSLASALRDVADRFKGKPRYPEDIDKALAQARKSGRPLLVYFYDDSPASLTINKSLQDPELKPMNGKFEVAMSPFRIGAAPCEKYEITHAPTLLILNPRLAKPETKPLDRIATARTPRELHRDLEQALETMKGTPSEPLPPPSAIPVPPSKDAPKEPLSDDEIDRKFIQARMTVAIDLNKRGMKAKAVDVLEDVLQSYPKHVLTKDVRALLEQIKK
jgi:hypothetical protein